MDGFGKFRYDFFGEFVSQDSNITADRQETPRKDEFNYSEPCNQIQSNKGKKVHEDSLMEFITDYFQGYSVTQISTLSTRHFINCSLFTHSVISCSGNVTDDFSDSSSCQLTSNAREGQITPKKLNAFDSYSSSMNTSAEMFTSPESSILNNAENGDNFSTNSYAICDCESDLQSPAGELRDPSLRRKSISYEIVFTNSKEKNGQVKIHIVPTKSAAKSLDENLMLSPMKTMSPIPQKFPVKNIGLSPQQENSLLRQRVLELERKLRCIETESERIIGELSRMIERKNDTISKLELQIAGIRIETSECK